MLILVIGGSGSGKSEYAENRCVELAECMRKNRCIKASENNSNCNVTPEEYGGKCSILPVVGKKLYIATMEVYDAESRARIERHRKLRAGKGFETLECQTHLEEADIPPKAVALLECMSNLLANEMFSEDGRSENSVETILAGLRRLMQIADAVVIVTNQVFSDGIFHDASTEAYLKNLGRINRELAELADEVVEVVHGIPLRLK